MALAAFMQLEAGRQEELIDQLDDEAAVELVEALDAATRPAVSGSARPPATSWTAPGCAGESTIGQCIQH